MRGHTRATTRVALAPVPGPLSWAPTGYPPRYCLALRHPSGNQAIFDLCYEARPLQSKYLCTSASAVFSGADALLPAERFWLFFRALFFFLLTAQPLERKS